MTLFDQITEAIKPHNDRMIAEARLARAERTNAELLAALKLAFGHIEHMAAYIGGKGLGYSFESLGEDMPGVRAAIATAEKQFVTQTAARIRAVVEG